MARPTPSECEVRIDLAGDLEWPALLRGLDRSLPGYGD